jgi:pimeloyl-ACP methyl ester carboxylesterase
MPFPFIITEHTIPAQHIREWPRATAASQDDILQLRIKQYTPLDNIDPQPGDLTIVGAHANGVPKEIYEALWADLHAQSRNHGFRIRGIWIADVAHQNYSGVLNEPMLGNDPSWYDCARDLLHMTNVFRNDMPRPIIGIGHSFGGTILTHLALMHARLFTSLILFDAVINTIPAMQTSSFNAIRMSTVRRDTWPSREAAAEGFRRSRFHAAWDPRVLDAWIAHGIRDVPDPAAGGKVALTNSRHQEVFTFVRPLYPYIRDDGTVDRAGAPDFDPAVHDKPFQGQSLPFYRGEMSTALERLPHVRPSVLWVYGGTSDVNPLPSARSERARACGSGRDGSGGIEAGRVAEIVIEGRGHLFPLEVPGLCAEHTATWIEKEMQYYRDSEREYKEWTSMPIGEKATLDQPFLTAIGSPFAKKKREGSSHGPKL